MGIRFPLKAVLSYSNQVEQGGGPASVAGGVAKTFTLPQDTDNVLVKLAASVKGGGVSATFQTSPDGGTTWYDVQRTSIVSNTPSGFEEWLSIPTINPGQRTSQIIASVVATGSVVSFGSVNTAIGNSPASTLSVKEISGLPVMGPYNRIFLRYTSAITSVINEAVTVYANNESNNT